ncbi:hypothetical protein F01_500136 [Burkholderia cenocepacia]|nr:hypothetical protein F01_500136 [Burkholderia cenocepacia]
MASSIAPRGCLRGARLGRFPFRRGRTRNRRRCRHIGQFFLSGDAHPAGRAARCDVPGLRVLPRGRRHRRQRPAARRAQRGPRSLARGHRRMLRRPPAAPPGRARSRDPRVQPAARRFPRDDRRDGDGRGGRHLRARRADARPLLRPRRERGRPAVGEDFRDAGSRRDHAVAPPRPRAATDEHPARHRRRRGDQPLLPAARTARARRHRDHRSGDDRARSGAAARVRDARRARARAFPPGRRGDGYLPACAGEGAAHHVGRVSLHSRGRDRTRLCRAARPAAQAEGAHADDRRALRAVLSRPTRCPEPSM